VFLGLTLPPAPVLGQGEEIRRQIMDSQRRLAQIRAERQRLQQEMEGVRSQAQDVTRDLNNIERQLSASRSALAEIDFQLSALTGDVEASTRRLVQTRERLREGGAVLSRRLRDIYKMGGLHSVRVLLGADSFTDLLNRYRYVRMIASYDRSLVERVTNLERALVSQDERLQRNVRDMGLLRQMQAGEVAELRSVESERQRTLEAFRNLEREATSQLDQLAIDEERMTGLIGDLEERRVEAERRSAVAGLASGPTTLSPDDAGSLDWPVEGRLIYRFGIERRPNGTVLRWNGVGIAADHGSPVRAIQAGTVVLAGPFEGYGPTVVLSHGGGFYTLYLYLEETGVVEGRVVQRGQVVGTVGGQDTPEGPHIEFQIRAPVAGSSPQAMDPLRWLRPRGGGT
jgi:septal ring factor EnvC (AmiA/AmiB activator)